MFDTERRSWNTFHERYNISAVSSTLMQIAVDAETFAVVSALLHVDCVHL